VLTSYGFDPEPNPDWDTDTATNQAAKAIVALTRDDF
jgi:hypothetical protein